MKYEIEQRVTIVNGDYAGVNGKIENISKDGNVFTIELDIPGLPEFPFREGDIKEYSIMQDVREDYKITEELKIKMQAVVEQFEKDNDFERGELDGDGTEDLGSWMKHYANYLCGNYDDAEIEEMEEKMEAYNGK